jgi:glucose-1-phosphate adenylyltransferase
VGGFREKPERPAPVPGDEGNCLASMGIYLFETGFLIDELRRNAADLEPGHDFGHHVLPRVIGRAPVHAFTFSGDGTGGGAYWRDVGTVDAYYRANMDLVSDDPGLDVNDTAWPIYGFQPSFPPPRVATELRPGGRPPEGPRFNIFANGTVAERWLRGAVGSDCRVEPGVVVEDSILFDQSTVGHGAKVRRAILDKGVVVRRGAGRRRPGRRPAAGLRGERRRCHLRPDGGRRCRRLTGEGGGGGRDRAEPAPAAS